ncbi:mandelate racemase/muconate lactonizing enzyme family protein [Haloglomus litoreum]|uniref:mandelate racemase/muconate lactonizing enzyme family protein n=1 Tax=Haloglomus litoreum TaxID=3034026 RepID=UPI0023E8D1A9|nr:enolase C-terminal domain-like protein [Haloglomus sp. DT116]
MEITDLDPIPVSVPYSVDFAISGGEVSAANHVLLRLHTDAGVVGLGEACPDPYFAPETMGSVVAAIEDHISPAIRGEDPSNRGRIHRAMDEAIRGNPFAKAAVDIACFDATGKHLGIPVSTLLGGRLRDRIEVGQSIGIGPTDRAVERARAWVDDGFSSIKVKVGTDPETDIERATAVAEAVGDRASIRVDANQGYRADQAVRVFSALESECDLLLVEQPVAADDLAGMARVTAALETPVLADESVFSPHDAIDIVDRGAADALSVKLVKAGGLYRSRQIAAVAAAAHLPLVVGSMVELGVGTAAGAHFAATLPAAYPSDVKGPTLHEASVLADPIRIEEGHTVVPEGPGLGVELDDRTVEAYRVE